MRFPPKSDAKILAEVAIADPDDPAQPNVFRGFAMILRKLPFPPGVRPQLAYWPNGARAFFASLPTDEDERNRLLVHCYRELEQQYTQGIAPEIQQ